MIELVKILGIPQPNNCSESQRGGGNCLSVLPEVGANSGQAEKGLAVLFGVVAAMAVVVIIIAAINFANSEGNPENIAKAKKTIIYALVGLIIALSAEAIVLTLIGRF
jgi:hypothetical protein